MAVLPLTIQGLGGVGKTQVALEYAHRFRADYDIIWWMNCGQAQYVDASLADLGQQLREVFGAAVPEEGGVTEVVEQVLQTLSEGLPDKRWLLVYDNAEDVEELSRLLAVSGGHVLITSRRQALEGHGHGARSWRSSSARKASAIYAGALPGITEADANKVAACPATTCRWPWPRRAPCWPTTDMSVAEYLRRLEKQPERDLCR